VRATVCTDSRAGIRKITGHNSHLWKVGWQVSYKVNPPALVTSADPKDQQRGLDALFECGMAIIQIGQHDHIPNVNPLRWPLDTNDQLWWNDQVTASCPNVGMVVKIVGSPFALQSPQVLLNSHFHGVISNLITSASHHGSALSLLTVDVNGMPGLEGSLVVEASTGRPIGVSSSRVD
jgi:hypothetical protein